jgi:hypothetical protein
MKNLVAVVMLVPTLAYAEFFTGNQLLAKMNSTEVSERIQAIGYIQGVFDTGQYLKHCAPDNAGITAGQIQDITRSYLEKNPAVRNLSADLLITEALRKIWPCANQNKGRGA